MALTHALGDLRAYVSGALTGVGAEVRRLYDTTADALRAARFEPYLPHLATDPVAHPHVKPADVYRADRTQVARADLLVAFLGRPSLGVGQELEIAASALVPVLVLLSRGDAVSRMAMGGPARIYGPIVFGNEAELTEDLGRLLPEIHRELTAYRRLDLPPIGDRLRRLRTRAGLSAPDLAVRLRVSESYVELLESAEPLVSNPSLALLMSAAAEVGSDLESLISTVPSPLIHSLRQYAIEERLSFREYEDLQKHALSGRRPWQMLSFEEWDGVRETRALALAGAEQLKLLGTS